MNKIIGLAIDNVFNYKDQILTQHVEVVSAAHFSENISYERLELL